MKRRSLLALLPLATTGCLDGSPSSSNYGGKNYTAPADVEVFDELKPMPEPPETVTVETARVYVADYEERRIHNELLGEDVSESHEGFVVVNADRDVVELDVEPAVVELVRETDHGYYLRSSARGEAEHWCAYDPPANSTRNCSSNARRNAHAVVHFVASDTHIRIPYDWYRCEVRSEPYRAPDESENVSLGEHDSSPKVQVYNASGNDHELDVTIDYVDDSPPTEVYAETIGTPPYLAVIANLAKRRGTYEIEATLDTGATETFEWVLTDDDAPSWTGTSIFVTPTDELWIDTVEPTEHISFPSSSCRNLLERTPDENADENGERMTTNTSASKVIGY